MAFEKPDWWGKDPLSNFIESAYQNCIATFCNHRETPFFKAIHEIDDIFYGLAQGQNITDNHSLPLFLGRCHSAYLGAIRMAASGQISETYILLRGCIENALYALDISDDDTDERTKIWLNRAKNYDGKNGTKDSRNDFTYGKGKKHLLGKDTLLGEEVSKLYGRTIEYGAHPNSPGHLLTSKTEKDRMSVHLLCPGTSEWAVCMQSTAEVGICCLKIFGYVFEEEFKSGGIALRIENIKWKEAKG